MKRLLLLLCAGLFAGQAARSQAVETLSENLTKQPDLSGYQKYIGGRLTAPDNTALLYTIEPRTIAATPFTWDYRQKKRSRTIVFDRIATQLYNASCTGLDTADCAGAVCPAPRLERSLAGGVFVITNVIPMERFTALADPCAVQLAHDEETLKAEVRTLKIPHKERAKAAEPRVYPSTRSDIPRLAADYPVFVLRDTTDAVCYWIPELNGSDTTCDALVFEPYIQYLRQRFIGPRFVYTPQPARYGFTECRVDTCGGKRTIRLKNLAETEVALGELQALLRDSVIITAGQYRARVEALERIREAEYRREREARRDRLRQKSDEAFRDISAKMIDGLAKAKAAGEKNTENKPSVQNPYDAARIEMELKQIKERSVRNATRLRK